MGAHPEKAKSTTGPTPGSRPPPNSEPLGDAEKSKFFADAEVKTEPAPDEVAPDEVAADEVAKTEVEADEPAAAEPVAPPVTPSPAPATPADPVTAASDPVTTASATSAASAASAEDDAVDVARAQPRRTWRQGFRQAGYTLVPYWFVASGVVLGVGGIVQDKALAGACGALAGVTAGLVYQNRARYYRRQAESLRDRLRAQRLESETAAASMRESMRALRTEVWELRLSARVFEMTTQFEASRAYDPEEKARIAALATQPLDLSALHDTPLAASVAADLAANRPSPAADVTEPADAPAPAPAAETASPVVDLTKSADSAAEQPAEIGQSEKPASVEPEPVEVIAQDSEPSEATAAEATTADDDEVAQDTALDDPAVEDDDAAEGQGARVIDLRGASNKPPTQQEHTAVAG